MPAVCNRCARANPAEALFCYFDGMPLSVTSAAGPLRAGTVPFPQPFIFPNGLSCGNFNQFVMGCQKNWDTAREYLVDGVWNEFLLILGRHDLAAAARRAAQEPDPDQALHQFLGLLPSEILQAPRLSVEPTQINFGQIRANNDMRFELAIVNQGMRLLTGAIETNVDWLAVGEGAGSSRHAFRTPLEVHVPVRIIGKNLRAGPRPLLGQLTIATNGGAEAVMVRAEVPVLGFEVAGPFAGAMTPREIAVRAKEHPKEAAELFEQGAVEAWYKGNGWDYPVQGPAGSGIGAVQQFFEALGLTRPPIVDVEPKYIHLAGVAGTPLRFLLEVKTQEKRPVFAHAQSSQPWLSAGRPKFAGNLVSIPIEIAALPDQDPTLRAMLFVRANGNQRFTIPVTIDVKPGKKAAAPAPEPAPSSRSRIPTLEPAEADLPPPASSMPVFGIPEPETLETGAFGMGRLVYWSGLAGGWSAFLGWLIAELTIGPGVGESLLLLLIMVLLIGAAIGGGLTLVGGLVTQQWREPLRLLPAGLAVGAVAGLVGSFLGSTLFELVGQRFALLALLARVLGWAFMGAAIGACEGIIQRDWVKLRNGLIGGTLGGFLGGLVFNPVSALVGSPLSSRAVGFVVLGFCVGLFIGLVQVLLKEAWLTVVEGFRPGRQLFLGDGQVTFGTSEKASLIFIASGSKGVEPIHLNITRAPDGGYLLEDNRSRTYTFVNGVRVEKPRRLNDGDLIRFGVNLVRFNERTSVGGKGDGHDSAARVGSSPLPPLRGERGRGEGG